MAIVQFGEIVTGIRGTIGGITFSAGPSGPIAKTYSKPARTITPPQSLQRARLSLQVATWRTIGDSAQAAWAVWAADAAQARTNSLGETYYLSGFQQYCAVNSRLALVDEAARTLPPTTTVPTAPTISGGVAALDAGTIDLELLWVSGTFPSGYAGIFEVAITPGAGRLTAPKTLYIMTAKVDPGDTGEDLSTPTIAKFGTANAGDTAWVKSYIQDDQGQRSAASLTRLIFAEV